MRFQLPAVFLSSALALAACGGQTSSGSTPDASVEAASQGGGGAGCAALAACCPHVDDPSSCLETAQSGQLTEAMCESDLATYASQGLCSLDGG